MEVKNHFPDKATKKKYRMYWEEKELQIKGIPSMHMVGLWLTGKKASVA